MQSTASAAGYSTGSTLVSAFAAYILLNNQSLPLGLMLGWVFFLALLGVTMAVPMKRQMINIEPTPLSEWHRGGRDAPALRLMVKRECAPPRRSASRV